MKELLSAKLKLRRVTVDHPMDNGIIGRIRHLPSVATGHYKINKREK
jgi:hypothetical protein